MGTISQKNERSETHEECFFFCVCASMKSDADECDGLLRVHKMSHLFPHPFQH
jgi:hypothetical protein